VKKRTRVTHLPGVDLAPDNRPLVAPIYQSVKFTFDDVAETQKYFARKRDGFYYSRVTNPTLRQLEQALAGLLKAGDHVVYFAESYQPTRSFIRRALGRFNVTASMLSITDHAALEQALAGTPTRLVVFECPTNPVLKVADLERITTIARRHGALTLLDNTLAGPHNHGQYDVDLYAHSLTKFVSGHGDVMGGAVIGRGELIESMREDFTLLGPTLDPHAAYLLLRGLKTYFVRWERQCRNAARVAEFLASHPAVARVRYPGLESDPGHALAQRQMDDFGTMVTFDVVAGAEAGTRVSEALQLFELTSSLGSTESLVVAPVMQQPRGFTPEQVAWTDIGPGTIRLSVGIEDADDLVADLGQALALL
jgi:cystathionine beta-lyase/cystathionine gamma-synthase